MSGADATSAVERLGRIAEDRLAAARDLSALSEAQPSVLAAIDRAASGEIEPEVSRAALESHLARREQAIARLTQDQDEWTALVASLPAGVPAGTALATAVEDCRALLVAIEASDAAFAHELANRRDQARGEMNRADGGRAAHRAYGARSEPAPRFTDRRG